MREVLDGEGNCGLGIARMGRELGVCEDRWGPGRTGLGWAKPGVEQGRGMEGKISPLQWGQDGETESSVGLGRKRLSIKTL